MALRARQDFETTKLKGVYRLGQDLPNITQLDIGRFQHLENWIPGKLYSIKKKRGVAQVLTGAEFVPDTCEVACPIDTIPEIQALDWETCYPYPEGADGTVSSNSSGQFNVIPTAAPGVNALATAGLSTGFVTGYPPASSGWQVFRVNGSSDYTLITPIPLPSGDTFQFARQTAQAGISGHTDALGYVLVGDYTPFGMNDRLAIVWFDLATQTASIMNAANGGVISSNGKWCKRGNQFYKLRSYTAGGNQIAFWTMSPGAPVSATTTRTDMGIRLADVFRTENKLWVISDSGPLLELDPISLATLNTYTTGLSSGIIGLHAVSDTLFYLLWENPSGTSINVYIFQLPSETRTLINTNTIHSEGCPFTPINHGNPHEHQFHLAGGYFYLNKGGITGTTSAGRIGPLFCPGAEGLIIEGDG